MNKGQLIFGLIDFIIVINYTENITAIVFFEITKILPSYPLCYPRSRPLLAIYNQK